MHGSDRFDLDATLTTVGQAATGVFCNVVFFAAAHGLAVATVVALIGVVLWSRRQRFGKPMLLVARKLSIVCGLMMLPGAIYWLSLHAFPATGVFRISSLGLLIFWSWISLHLTAEELNYQWS